MLNVKNLRLPNIALIQGLQLYKQYQGDTKSVAFFTYLKQYLYNYMQERLDLLEQTSYRFPYKNYYLQFYYENLFGISRTFGEQQVKNQYDTGKKYDVGLKYDDTDFDGMLDIQYYAVLVKYLTDYADLNYTLGWIYAFVYEFCDFNYIQEPVTITETVAGITITCPRRTGSELLSRIFLDKDTYPNMPICDITFDLTN